MADIKTTPTVADTQEGRPTADGLDGNESIGGSGLAIVRLGACGRCRVACDSKTRQLYGLPLLLFLLLLGASVTVVVNLQINERSSLKAMAVRTGVTSSGLLERTLDRGLSSAVFLGQTMRIFPDLVEKNFTQLVQPLLNDRFLAVANLQMAPNNTIKYIVPLAGNEAAIGLNLLNPYLYNGTMSVIRNRDLTLIGPITLAQGGVGVLGRFPVFLPNGSDPVAPPTLNDPYWGLISSLIRIDQLVNLGKLNSLRDEGYEYTLRKQGSDTAFYKSAGDLTDTISCYISVPHGNWELQIAPAAGWKNDPLGLFAQIIIALVISLLLPTILLITLKNDVLFNNARFMQKQIAAGKERETKMESTTTELNRKLAEANRIITRRVREVNSVVAAYQLCRDMITLINLSRPQSVAARVNGRTHLIQHATEKARMHAQQFTQAQATTEDVGRTVQASGDGRASPIAVGAPQSEKKALTTTTTTTTNLGSSSPVNSGRAAVTIAQPPPTTIGAPATSIDTSNLAIDLSITVEQIAHHPIAVELLKDIMVADHSLENLMFYLDVRYFRKAYDDTQRGIMSGASASAGDALVRSIGEDIFCTYIGALAPCEINISRETRTKLQRSVGGTSMTAARTCAPRQFSRDVFDGAVSEIKQLIRDNGLRQLQRHQSWSLCLEMLDIIPLTRVTQLHHSSGGDSGLRADSPAAGHDTGGARLSQATADGIGSGHRRSVLGEALGGSSFSGDEDNNDSHIGGVSTGGVATTTATHHPQQVLVVSP